MKRTLRPVKECSVCHKGHTRKGKYCASCVAWLGAFGVPFGLVLVEDE